MTLAVVLGIALFVVFFGKILSHALRFFFYILLIVLAVVFIFGVSLSDVMDFVQELVFMTF
tara:strand:- start:256 stop:438 length:183 start_codon:yes stop_codon:yes gene_type:complete